MTYKSEIKRLLKLISDYQKPEYKNSFGKSLSEAEKLSLINNINSLLKLLRNTRKNKK